MVVTVLIYLLNRLLKSLSSTPNPWQNATHCCNKGFTDISEMCNEVKAMIPAAFPLPSLPCCPGRESTTQRHTSSPCQATLLEEKLCPIPTLAFSWAFADIVKGGQWVPMGANGCQWVPLQMGLETIFCHLTIFCCSTRQNFWGLSVTENFTWWQLFFSSLTTLMRVVLVGKVDTIVMPLWCHCDDTACDDTTDWRSSKCCWSVAGSSLAPRKDRLLENLE